MKKGLNSRIYFNWLLNVELWHICVTLLSKCLIFTHPPLPFFLFRARFAIISNTYKRLGQFDYYQSHWNTGHIHTCIGKHNGSNWIYIGEVKEGTDNMRHGIGIELRDYGHIKEGYWKDGILHGRGRYIYGYGDCYSGEFKEGNYDGQGIYYKANGDRYEGGFKNNKRSEMEHCTTKTETRSMKEDGRIIIITDMEHCTQKMETSIQAYGIMIGKGKEKLTTKTERSI